MKSAAHEPKMKPPLLNHNTTYNVAYACTHGVYESSSYDDVGQSSNTYGAKNRSLIYCSDAQTGLFSYNTYMF